MIQLMKKHIKNEKGLTLIELLAVIVILGIIAAIAIPSIGNVIQKSREDAIKADAIQIINGAKMYIAGEGAATTLDEADLADYVNDVTTFDDGYDISIADDNTISLTGEGTKGNVTINFNSASISQINDAAKGVKTIPAQ